MIYVVIISFLYSAISGLSEWHRIKDRQLYKEGNNDYKQHSRKWHNWEFIEAALSIGTGVAIAFDYFGNNNLFVGVACFLVVASIRWNIRDGVYNMKNGNGFYYQSPNTTSAIEQLGTPVVKISFLICALVFRFLL